MPTKRELYTHLVDHLKNIMFQKGILERPSYMELSKKLGFTYNWIKDKKDTLKSHSPQKKTFNDLFNRLTEKYKEQFRNHWKTIEQKFQALYNTSFPNNSELPTLEQNTNRSIKRKFFDDIKEIIKNYFPKIRIFDTDLSRIFFNRARALKDSHLKGDYEFRRLEKSILFNMIYKTRFLTKQILEENVRDIKDKNHYDLNNLKKEIEKFIIDFIFSNPFDVKYIDDSSDIGSKYFRPEFDLTLEIWFEISKAKKEPQILKHIRRLVSYESLGRLARGYIYSWEGIKNMLEEIENLVPRAVYNTILIKSCHYIKIRGLVPASPRDYHPSWNVESTIKFHVIMLLIRDLGLDILSLEPIPASSFKKIHGMTSITFERHHIFKNDKKSIDVNRLVLVIHRNHYILESQTSLILSLIKARRSLTIECPIYYKKFLKNWKSRWQEYLERRKYLLKNGIAKFLNTYFIDNEGTNYIIKRFFKNLSLDQIELKIKSMLKSWIQKGRPTPILNPQIPARLSVDSTKPLINKKLINNTKKFNS
ncbi:MAG: hypothetical protein ACFE9V_09145 [Candidatus Hodarchaeota archaeon]